MVMLQRLDDLIEKQRHAVIDFRFRRGRVQPDSHFGPATVDDFGAIESDEFVKHVAKIRGRMP